MKKFLLFSLAMLSLSLGANEVLQQRNGLSGQDFNKWQEIFSDAGTYGKHAASPASPANAVAVKNIYNSLNLNTLHEIAAYYNDDNFAPYTPGIARVQEIIRRINTHSYPMS